MRFVERQARLERQIYAAIDELEDIFGVEVPLYPEVRWLGRKGHFEDLGFPEYYRDEIEGLKAQRCSALMSKSKVIIINEDCSEHINEEATHFVHTEVSGIHYKNKDSEELIHLHMLVEMFGYLGSKFLDSTRKNSFKDYPDYFSIAGKNGLKFERFAEMLNEMMCDDVSERLIHSQGYGLAERVFYAMQTSQINNKKIRHLIRQNFDKKNSAIETFRHLRQEFWPV